MLKKTVKILLLVAAIVLLVQAVLVSMGVTFASDKARRILVQQIETITQREARIDGEVLITISLLPQLLVERIHVLNQQGFGEQDFVTISEARVRIPLIPLLSGNLHLEEITADHTQVNLIRKKDGSHNWSFAHLMQTKQTPAEGRQAAPEAGVRRRISLDVFELTDITINFRDEAVDQPIVNHLSRLIVDLEDKTNPQAFITGNVQGYAYDLAFESDPLKMIALDRPWKMVGVGTAAARKIRIESVLRMTGQDIAADVEINVRDIDLGLLLEEIGIITGQDAASDNLKLKASFRGDDLSKFVQNADFQLQLERGYWRWRAIVNDETREIEFDKASLNASLEKPVELHLDGRLLDEAIRLDFVTNPLSDFLDKKNKLDVDLSVHVVGSDVSLKGVLDLPVTSRRFRLDMSLKGSDLENLNKILASELPPFNNYSVSGSVSSNERGLVLKADDATIGDTHFRGSVIIERGLFKPLWTINLDSRQLQIRDFEFADKRLDSLDAETTKASLQKPIGETGQEPGYRLKQIVDDPAAHVNLNVKAASVLAGDTALGGFSLKLKLLDDTLILEKAELDIPGGRIEGAASFRIENELITGSLQLDVEKFETGVVVNYFTQGTRQGGLISARVDLELGGNSFDRLLDQASGKLDVAVWPKNVSSNRFDLWATNLFLLILPEIRKKESRMNCLVALMDLEDGIMKEDFFGIDTTKVWMLGNINVNFPNEHLTLSLYPRSKTARLFAVQAPIRAEGSFDDIHLVTNPVDITAAYLSFITSPLHVPARWVFGDKVPEDASATCEKFFDREYVKRIAARVEAEEQKDIEEWLESD